MGCSNSRGDSIKVVERYESKKDIEEIERRNLEAQRIKEGNLNQKKNQQFFKKNPLLEKKTSRILDDNNTNNTIKLWEVGENKN